MAQLYAIMRPMIMDQRLRLRWFLRRTAINRVLVQGPVRVHRQSMWRSTVSVEFLRALYPLPELVVAHGVVPFLIGPATDRQKKGKNNRAMVEQWRGVLMDII